MRLGKLERESLIKNVLAHFKPKRKELLLGPEFGVDFAVIRHGGAFLITSTDPITGVVEDIGWYSMHVSSNDVATSGNRPQFAEVLILLGEDEGDSRAEDIAKGLAKAASQLGVDIVGGHTERTRGLTHSVVATTAFSFAKSYVTAAGAKEGDYIVLTKTAGIEGTSILATARKERLGRLGRRVLSEARGLRRKLSVVKEAEVAFKTGHVDAMHDPTEGGVLGGLYEMSVGSGLGFVVYEEKIPLESCTRAVCGALKVDPLRLIASGSMLMAVERSHADCVTEVIRRTGTDATVIGRFTGRNRTLVKSSGAKEEVGETVLDELWRLTADEL
jgi:hydrogenase expression/formation protein HypE